jgi:hypothetical protein
MKLGLPKNMAFWKELHNMSLLMENTLVPLVIKMENLILVVSLQVDEIGFKDTQNIH